MGIHHDQVWHQVLFTWYIKNVCLPPALSSQIWAKWMKSLGIQLRNENCISLKGVEVPTALNQKGRGKPADDANDCQV